MTLALRPPNYDLRERMFDGGTWLPRWLWHVMRAVASVLLTVLVARAFRLPWMLAGGAALVIAGVLPHVIGVASQQYPFDPPDWLADAWMSSAGIVTAAALIDVAAGVLALGFYAAGYRQLYPWASP